MTYSVSSTTLSISRRIYSTLILILLIAACSFANAEVLKAKALPCLLTDAEVAGMSGDAGADIQAVKHFKETANHMLHDERFEALDCLADSLRSSKETFPGGMWKLHNLYTGLSQPLLHPTEEDWTTHMALVNKWVTVNPKSITARVTLAESYVSYAGSARGTGYADTVSESGWKLFEQRNLEAKRVLDEASELPSKCPEWYLAMQFVAQYQSWENSESRALFDRAVKFEPAYYYYYRAYSQSIQPKWGGEPGDVEKFLKAEADRVGGDAGDIVYFQAAADLVCGCQSDQELDLSWPRIQKGFAALEERSGSAPENLNIMASLASSFNDPLVADKMFDRIGDQWSEGKWGTQSRYDSTKQWAKQWAPMMARQRSTEESAAANLRTPEGQRYQATVDEKIRPWIQSCLETSGGSDPGKYELLFRISKEGMVDDMLGSGASPAGFCLSRKIGETRQANQPAFPPPPQPAYWVRFDFSSGNWTSATLK